MSREALLSAGLSAEHANTVLNGTLENTFPGPRLRLNGERLSHVLTEWGYAEPIRTRVCMAVFDSGLVERPVKRRPDSDVKMARDEAIRLVVENAYPSAEGAIRVPQCIVDRIFTVYRETCSSNGPKARNVLRQLGLTLDECDAALDHNRYGQKAQR